MGIAVDAVSDVNAATASPRTLTHAGGSAPSIAIVIGAVATDYFGTAATYAGSAMTELQHTSGNYNGIKLWYLISPTGGSQTVSMPYVGGNREASLWVMTLTGSDLTSPIRDSDKLSEWNTTGPSITLTTQSGDMCMDGAVITDQVCTVGSGQTQIGSNHTFSGIPSSLAGGSYEAASGASTVMNWDHDGNNNNSIQVACSVKPAPPLRERLVRYIENAYLSKLHGRLTILDVLGRQVPLHQIEFDNFIRSGGAFLPTTQKATNLISDEETHYIESLLVHSIDPPRGSIEVTRESMLESLLSRLGGSV